MFPIFNFFFEGGEAYMPYLHVLYIDVVVFLLWGFTL